MQEYAERSIFKEYNKTIWSKLHKAIKEYRLIQQGDRIAVCISGGKDSMLMAKCLQLLEKQGFCGISCEYIVMDPGYSSANLEKIVSNAEALGIPIKVYSTRIFESTEKTGKHPCFLCARLRRGWLYKKAQELGCNKIALGHHFDDVIETILMGMLYGSQVQTMMPKLHSENYAGVQVIRPLYLIREKDILSWGMENGLEFIRCACRVTEKKGEGSSKRGKVKELLAELRKSDPAVDMNIFRSVENVNLQTLISYHSGDEYHSFHEAFDEGLTLKGKKQGQQNTAE